MALTASERLRPYRVILRLVWPLALGMVNNAIMQFADRAYLAHDSMESLGAVLPAGMLMWIFAGFFQSVIGYASVFVGQCHGAGDEAGCRAVCRAAFVLALVFGVLSVPLVFVGDRILALAVDSPRLLADERTYFDITMAGAVFVYLQMAAASFFTGRGKTRIVFWGNLAGNLLNVALDPILIFGWCGLPRLGIAGAAYATVIAMAVQAAVLIVALRPAFDFRLPVAKLPSLLRFGVPAGLYTVLNMLSFTVFVFVTEGVGELELAVSNACFSVNYLLFAPMEGFALGASTLVAQAIGRGDPDAASRDVRRTLVLGVGLVTILSALVLVFSRPVLGIFAAQALAHADEFQSLGFTLLILMAAWQVFDAADIIIAGALKGGGDTRFVMGWMFSSAFGLWLPLVFAVRAFHNTMPALWGTMIVYVLVICAGSAIRWYNGKWREIRLV